MSDFIRVVSKDEHLTLIERFETWIDLANDKPYHIMFNVKTLYAPIQNVSFDGNKDNQLKDLFNKTIVKNRSQVLNYNQSKISLYIEQTYEIHMTLWSRLLNIHKKISYESYPRTCKISGWQNDSIRTELNQESDLEKIRFLCFEFLMPLRHHGGILELDLSENEFTEFSGLPFGAFFNVVVLNLFGCSISQLLYDVFKCLPKLQYLNLSHNLLESLDEWSFPRLINLEVLDLSYNRIRSIRPNTFRWLQSLEELDLTHNPCDSIDHLTGLDKVRYFRELNSICRFDWNSYDLGNEFDSYKKRINSMFYFRIRNQNLNDKKVLETKKRDRFMNRLLEVCDEKSSRHLEAWFYQINTRKLPDELRILVLIEDEHVRLNRKWAVFTHLVNSRDVDWFNQENMGFQVKQVKVRKQGQL